MENIDNILNTFKSTNINYNEHYIVNKDKVIYKFNEDIFYDNFKDNKYINYQLDLILNKTYNNLKILCCKSLLINTIQPIEYLLLTSYNKNKKLINNLNDLSLKLPNIKKIYVYWNSATNIIIYKYNNKKNVWTIDMNNLYTYYASHKYFEIQNIDNVKLKLCYKHIRCYNIKNLKIVKGNIMHYKTCYLSLINIDNIINKLSSEYFMKENKNYKNEKKNKHYKISYNYYYNNKNIRLFENVNKNFNKFIIDSVIDIMK